MTPDTCPESRLRRVSPKLFERREKVVDKIHAVYSGYLQNPNALPVHIDNMGKYLLDSMQPKNIDDFKVCLENMQSLAKVMAATSSKIDEM